MASRYIATSDFEQSIIALQTAFDAATAAGPSAVPTKGGIVSSVHLAKLEASGTPTVAIIGDSTVSTADYVSTIDSMWSKIQSELRARYPTKTFTFKDFSIGGRILADFTTVLSSGWPSWYSNHAVTWNSYVSAAAPTTLFIVFGINDTYTEAASTWATALAAITAYASVPDIIIVTNHPANPAAGAPWNTSAYQNGYLAAAALQRSIARSGNSLGVSLLPQIGLIDIGRFFNQAVLGRDPVRQIMKYAIPPTAPVVAGVTTTATFSYALPTCDGDFDLIVQVNNGSGFPGASTVMSLGMFDSQGTAGLSGTNGFVAIIPNGGSAVYANTYYSNGAANISTNTNNWVAGTNIVQVSVQGEHIRILVNGVITQDQLLPGAKTTFAPWISITSPPNGTTVQINSYAAGKMAPNTPILSQSVAFGSIGGTDSGNGINHLSSDGLNLIYGPAIAAALGR